MRTPDKNRMSYTVIKEYNKQHSHIVFDGTFQGKPVTWDTHFFTLNGYNQENNIQDTNLKQFIDIKSTNSNTLELTIALNIDKINQPNIQKMMIMIKQYKNLSFGRHEYG